MPNDAAPTTITPPVVAPESPATMKPLYKALVAAQRAAMAVGKDAENTYHKYKYASAEAVIAEARGALNGAGLALTLLSWDRHLPAVGDHPHTRIEVHYRLLHEEGVALDLSASSYVIPEKGRPADKAEAGALTTNLSYVLRTLLLLPREDEGTSPDTRDDRNFEPQRLVPRPAPSKPAFDLTSRLDRLAKAATGDEIRAIDAEVKPAWDDLSAEDKALYTAERNAAIEAGKARAAAAKAATEPTPAAPPPTEPAADPAPAAAPTSPRAHIPPPPAPPKAPARKSVPF